MNTLNTYKVFYIADEKKKDYMIVIAENERQAKRFTSESLFELGYSHIEILKVKHIE